MTPLHLAAFCCFKDVVLWLLNAGADVNAVNKWGAKPVDMVDKEHDDIIMLLHEHKAAYASVRDYLKYVIIRLNL